MTMGQKRRLPAEWERQSFIQFTFPHKNSDWANNYEKNITCFVNIIEKVAEFNPVIVGCENVNNTQILFKNHTKFPIHFVMVASNDSWTRDHGAITILEGDQPKLLDFIFNGWGNKFESALDNKINLELSDTLFKALPIASKAFHLGRWVHRIRWQGRTSYHHTMLAIYYQKFRYDPKSNRTLSQKRTRPKKNTLVKSWRTYWR